MGGLERFLTAQSFKKTSRTKWVFFVVVVFFESCNFILMSLVIYRLTWSWSYFRKIFQPCTRVNSKQRMPMDVVPACERSEPGSRGQNAQWVDLVWLVWTLLYFACGVFFEDDVLLFYILCSLFFFNLFLVFRWVVVRTERLGSKQMTEAVTGAVLTIMRSKDEIDLHMVWIHSVYTVPVCPASCCFPLGGTNKYCYCGISCSIILFYFIPSVFVDWSRGEFCGFFHAIRYLNFDLRDAYVVTWHYTQYKHDVWIILISISQNRWQKRNTARGLLPHRNAPWPAQIQAVNVLRCSL